MAADALGGVVQRSRAVARVSSDGAGRAANRAYVPVIRNEFVELIELGFRGSSHPGLFGGKDELLTEWRSRLEGSIDSTGT